MPRPLVPRYLRLEVDERVLASGTVRQPLDPERGAAARRTGSAQNGSRRSPSACSTATRIRPTSGRSGSSSARRFRRSAVSISSDVVPEIREYERTSTTLANVYVQRLVDRYLRRLETAAARARRRGRPVRHAVERRHLRGRDGGPLPVRLLESGPAAGALATAYFGALIGHPDLLSFDMGGTTAKLCVIEKASRSSSPTSRSTASYRFKKGSGLPVKMPVIEMIEIGAGGGSIARIDSLGRLRVGPESAGARPGRSATVAAAPSRP